MKNSQIKAVKTIQFIIAMAFMMTACGSSSYYEGSEYNESGASQTESATDSITNDYQFGISQADGQIGAIGQDSASSQESTEQSNVSSEVSDDDTSQTDSQTQQSSGDTNIKLVSDKLVYRCSLDIETKNYDEDLDNLLSLIDKYEGIIQNSNEYDDDNYWYETDNVKTHGTKRITLEVRIPQAKYKEFIDTVGTVGRVRQNSQQVDNISYDYYNTQADIEQLKIQESRLLDMMKQAQTIDEMITVEDRLTEVQNELSKLQTKLVGLDTDVAYSYVDISLQEVYEYTSTPVETKGFLQRLGEEVVQAFKDMITIFEDLIIFIFGAIPRLIPFALIVFIAYKAYKYYMRHRKPRKPREKKNRHNNMYYGPVNQGMNQGWYNGYNPNMNGNMHNESENVNVNTNTNSLNNESCTPNVNENKQSQSDQADINDETHQNSKETQTE